MKYDKGSNMRINVPRPAMPSSTMQKTVKVNVGRPTATTSAMTVKKPNTGCKRCGN